MPRRRALPRANFPPRKYRPSSGSKPAEKCQLGGRGVYSGVEYRSPRTPFRDLSSPVASEISPLYSCVLCSNFARIQHCKTAHMLCSMILPRFLKLPLMNNVSLSVINNDVMHQIIRRSPEVTSIDRWQPLRFHRTMDRRPRNLPRQASSSAKHRCCGGQPAITISCRRLSLCIHPLPLSSPIKQ